MQHISANNIDSRIFFIFMFFLLLFVTSKVYLNVTLFDVKKNDFLFILVIDTFCLFSNGFINFCAKLFFLRIFA